MKNPSNPDEIIFLANPTLRIGKPWNIRRKPWLYSLPKRFWLSCRSSLTKPLPGSCRRRSKCGLWFYQLLWFWRDCIILSHLGNLSSWGDTHPLTAILGYLLITITILVFFHLPSGKHTKNYGESPFLNGYFATISMAIFQFANSSKTDHPMNIPSFVGSIPITLW